MRFAIAWANSATVGVRREPADQIPLEGTGELITKDVPDQLVVSGVVGDGTVVSAQVRGGMTRGMNSCSRSMAPRATSCCAATDRASTQRQELTVQGARGAADDWRICGAGEVSLGAGGRAGGSPYNVAQLYAKLGEAIRGWHADYPGFEAAIARHRMLDMVTQAARTGQKQLRQGGRVNA